MTPREPAALAPGSREELRPTPDYGGHLRRRFAPPRRGEFHPSTAGLARSGETYGRRCWMVPSSVGPWPTSPRGRAATARIPGAAAPAHTPSQQRERSRPRAEASLRCVPAGAVRPTQSPPGRFAPPECKRGIPPTACPPPRRDRPATVRRSVPPHRGHVHPGPRATVAPRSRRSRDRRPPRTGHCFATPVALSFANDGATSVPTIRCDRRLAPRLARRGRNRRTAPSMNPRRHYRVSSDTVVRRPGPNRSGRGQRQPLRSIRGVEDE
jgi:hypothetical protein